MKLNFFLFFLFFLPFTAVSQDHLLVSGKVYFENYQPLSDVVVSIDSTSYRVTTNSDGFYELYIPFKKRFSLVSTRLGYVSQKKDFTPVKNQSHIQYDFHLVMGAHTTLNEVDVVYKPVLKNVKESPYNVVSLDLKRLQSSSIDLAQALDKASGVKVRTSGGVGSSASISINGFTGRHVKVFIDGVPMQGLGSAFQINNLPISIAERIDVYKGVVPIEFGTDAIGGVINIITNKNSSSSFLDASYSYGSFNTHKANINIGKTTKNGITYSINAFQNSTDNSYSVLTKVLNVETGTFSVNNELVRRFHDDYLNRSILANIGLVDKPWADKLMLGFNYAEEEADIQNSNIMQIVFGQRKRNGRSIMPSLSYSKEDLWIENLSLKWNVNYNRNYNQNIDTAARLYNWLGEYTTKRTQGETSISTLGEFFNRNASSTASLTYKNKGHEWMLSDVFTTFSRFNADPMAAFNPDASPLNTLKRRNDKNVLGLSYSYHHKDKINLTTFGKLYGQYVMGPVSVVNGNTSQIETRSQNFNSQGYGIATTYFFNLFQLKTSYEKAFRLPTPNELFGDEVLEIGNSLLRPENSNNFNVNIAYHQNINKIHNVMVDAGWVYRDVKDFIRRVIEPRYGTASSSNHGQVRGWGMDLEMRYDYKNIFSVGSSFTWQRLRNKERYVTANSTQLSTYYNDLVPNNPYFFGNMDATYNFLNLGQKKNTLSIAYNFLFVNSFFLNWESLGNANTKNTVPTQISHDLGIVYAFNKGKYNIALEGRNLANSFLYDNFSLQKPGRNFAVKFRIHLNNYQ